MEPKVLTDPTQFPSEEVIFSHIGRQRTQWEALFRFTHAEHPDFVATWRYYNDGKSWLMNVSRKKKTVFWHSVTSGTFRITAYFTDKARDATHTNQDIYRHKHPDSHFDFDCLWRFSDHPGARYL